MAEQGKDDDLKEGADAPKVKKPMSGTVKIILAAVGVVALLGINTALVLLVSGGSTSQPSPEHDAQGAEPAKEAKAPEDGGHGESKEKSAANAGAPARWPRGRRRLCPASAGENLAWPPLAAQRTSAGRPSNPVRDYG